MNEGFSPSMDTPKMESWSGLTTNDEIKVKLHELAQEAALSFKGQGLSRQEMVMRLEKAFADSGYPYPVSVSLSPESPNSMTDDVSFSTLSALDKSPVRFP